MESFLTHAGYAALIIFGFIEACSIPISSEITFGFAGVLAYEGHLNLILVIIIGSLAELAGSYVSYAVGRLGGGPLLGRLGQDGLGPLEAIYRGGQVPAQPAGLSGVVRA